MPITTDKSAEKKPSSSGPLVESNLVKSKPIEFEPVEPNPASLNTDRLDSPDTHSLTNKAKSPKPKRFASVFAKAFGKSRRKSAPVTSPVDVSQTPWEQLAQRISGYLSKSDFKAIQRAYEFGAAAHKDQTRVSGEPYIHHPLSVAIILADIKMDAQTLMAAILHDVIEDTPTAKTQLAELFGHDVAHLVDGVSKLDQINFDSKAEAKAASFRKLILAMVDDIRVILIKLADRLHNMRTLDVMPPNKQRRIALETIEVYAPIAMRLGINSWRLEMQDLGFKAYYPNRYRVLEERVRKARGNRKEVMSKVEITLAARMQDMGIEASLQTREKTLFSTYNKMRTRHVRYSDIMDLFALRIVVQTVDQCYRSLGIVHDAYKPIPGMFKDYIAIPKANGYQGLHTKLVGPHGIPIEVQIRTEEMNRFAESGIAAHWIYKEGDEPGVRAETRTHKWLQDLLEIQKKAGNSIEFLENVKIDLFPDEVYVFSPKGNIYKLPAGATPVDFAYAVHTDVGNNCMSCKIDRRMAPLSTKLASGQTVEIITSVAARPSPSWLNFVATAKARSSIRHYLKHLTDEDAIRMGSRLLDQALGAYGLSLSDVPSGTMSLVLEEYNLESTGDLLKNIGLGNRSPRLVARRIAPGESPQPVLQSDKAKALTIKGTEGLAISYGKCCYPIPGDEIVGFMSSGRGIVIHRRHCKNLAEYRDQPEKWLDVEWSDTVDQTLPVALRIEVNNGRGVLAELATIIANADCNIETVSQEDRDSGISLVQFVLSVKDRIQLARILRQIRQRKFVLKVTRPKG